MKPKRTQVKGSTPQLRRVKEIHAKEVAVLKADIENVHMLMHDALKELQIAQNSRDALRAELNRLKSTPDCASCKSTIDNLKQQVIDLIHAFDAAIGARKEAFARVDRLMAVIYKSHEVTTNIIKESESAQ